MICSNCGENEADVLIKQVVNNEVYDLNLCRDCAEELGFISSEEAPSITISFSFRDAGIFQLGKALSSAAKSAAEKQAQLRCPSCGTEYRDFEKNSLLGCASCYETFRVPLGEHLQRTQGAESHLYSSGSFNELGVWEPKTDDTRMPVLLEDGFADIMSLKYEIAEAVSKEDYEKAGLLKDKLLKLDFSRGGS